MTNKLKVIEKTIIYLQQMQEDGQNYIHLPEKEPAQNKAIDLPVGAPLAGAQRETTEATTTGAREGRPYVDNLDREQKLALIAQRVARCTKCHLHRTRNNTVPGLGNPAPDVMFIGEGPGHDEDLKGEPFVGPAGKILTRLINKMGYQRQDVFIANIVKCRPTVDMAMVKDRPPTLDEMQACLPYLHEQIAILKPKVIVCLGNTALEGLFGVRGITKLRGQWRKYDNIPTMPTCHPSYLLRQGGENKAAFWDVWHDMEAVLKFLATGKQT